MVSLAGLEPHDKLRLRLRRAVTDNADLIFQQRALDLILPKLAKVIQNLQTFALQYKDMPTLGFTHYQAVSAPPPRSEVGLTFWV